MKRQLLLILVVAARPAKLPVSTATVRPCVRPAPMVPVPPPPRQRQQQLGKMTAVLEAAPMAVLRMAPEESEEEGEGEAPPLTLMKSWTASPRLQLDMWTGVTEANPVRPPAPTESAHESVRFVGMESVRQTRRTWCSRDEEGSESTEKGGFEKSKMRRQAKRGFSGSTVQQ